MAVTQKYRKVRRKVKSTSGHRSSEKAKTEKCATGNAGHAFLKCTFLPVREGKHSFLRNQKKLEREFYNSLSNLVELYNISLPEANRFPYPLNISAAYREVKEQLSRVNDNLQLIVAQDETRLCSLATVETFSIGQSLHYLQVRPLAEIIGQKEHSKRLELLLSVFAYLHFHAGIPWHTDRGTFLNGCYDMLKEWYLEGEYEEGELVESLEHFGKMETDSNKIYELIKEHSNLTAFAERIMKFEPVTKEDKSLLELAKAAYDLYEKYPYRSIFDSVHDNLFDPEDEERIRPEHYLSFFWDEDDFLYDHLIEYVNSYLQECAVMDEPVAIQFFDTKQEKPLQGLVFEKALFSLLEHCYTVLNFTWNEKHI